eukprot:TRINITY_DN66273_c9_g2_i1.p1 TRINITY_DN66273_c9_g2~~TRINITY_DN66273_c9_g2_i1.p1  ORF type:complete len:388 (-),score=195.70 TRINITY_DN66273_c9_g2_i1:86-1249(-)
MSEWELLNVPASGLTSVAFGKKDSGVLLLSSWDDTVRVYDVEQNVMRYSYRHSRVERKQDDGGDGSASPSKQTKKKKKKNKKKNKGKKKMDDDDDDDNDDSDDDAEAMGKVGVLSCCFGWNNKHVFSAGVDGKLVVSSMTDESERVLGTHDAPIRHVLYNDATNATVTGSWDKSIGVWDHRVRDALQSRFYTQGKVFAMDAHQHRLVVGTSGRHVYIFDLRNTSQPEQVRVSSLVHQTRAIKCFADGTGYALSSIEGRVSVEYFDPDAKVQARKYAFKAHRQVVNGAQTLYPVNAIAVHPLYGTFATGGSDGVINVWDGRNKKRICRYPAYSNHVAALDFSHDGKLMAVAVSYTWDNGPPTTGSTESVYIRKVKDNEVKPKLKSNAE